MWLPLPTDVVEFVRDAFEVANRRATLVLSRQPSMHAGRLSATDSPQRVEPTGTPFSRSMHPSSDCWRSSSLGASSKTVNMPADQQAEGITGGEPVQRLDHLRNLRRIHRAPPFRPCAHGTDFMMPLPSPFLVVDVLPGGEFERA
jgi:hypothetical protein